MTQDEWNKAEDFMEGYMLDLTYDVVTQKINLVDLIDSDEEVILCYDPFTIGGTDQSWLLQDLIDHYVEQEEYEKCARLLKMKVKVEKGLLDLSDRLYLTDEDFITNEQDQSIAKLLKDTLGSKFNQN